MKLKPNEYVKCDTLDKFIKVAEANCVPYLTDSYDRGEDCIRAEGYANEQYYIDMGYFRVSYEDLLARERTDTDSKPAPFSLCDVYVCTKDVDAYLRRGSVVAVDKYRTYIVNEEQENFETPWETQLRLATLLEFSEGVLVKILNKS